MASSSFPPRVPGGSASIYRHFPASSGCIGFVPSSFPPRVPGRSASIYRHFPREFRVDWLDSIVVPPRVPGGSASIYPHFFREFRVTPGGRACPETRAQNSAWPRAHCVRAAPTPSGSCTSGNLLSWTRTEYRPLPRRVPSCQQSDAATRGPWTHQSDLVSTPRAPTRTGPAIWTSRSTLSDARTCSRHGPQ